MDNLNLESQLNTTDPTKDDFIEPSLEQQLRSQDESEQIINNIFKETRFKLNIDDPVVQLIIYWKYVNAQITSKTEQELQQNFSQMTDMFANATQEQLAFLHSHLQLYAEQITRDLILHQSRMIQEFDDGLNTLREVLTEFKTERDHVIQELQVKVENWATQVIDEKLSSDLKKIANNANNQINNQRNMLIGGVAGLMVGIFLCAVLLLLFR